MSLSNFTLSKTWESAEDFPTFEPEEAKVRSDMQYLFAELADKLNEVITKLKSVEAASGASCIGVNPISGIDSSVTVQDALTAIYLVALQAQAGTILPGAIGTTELADLAATTAKLADLAVTTPKLVDGAVTGAKTDFSGGLTIGGALEQNGQLNINDKVILDSDCYGDTLPADATEGRLFFLKAT